MHIHIEWHCLLTWNENVSETAARDGNVCVCVLFCFVWATREVAIHKCRCRRYWAFCLMKYIIIISMLLAVTFIWAPLLKFPNKRNFVMAFLVCTIYISTHGDCKFCTNKLYIRRRHSGSLKVSESLTSCRTPGNECNRFKFIFYWKHAFYRILAINHRSSSVFVFVPFRIVRFELKSPSLSKIASG